MSQSRFPLLALLLAALTIPACTAPSSPAREPSYFVESEWITPVAGQSEQTLGARVESVEEPTGDGPVAVHLSLPSNGEDIEEVVVLGRPEDVEMEAPVIEQPKRFEFHSSPEKNGLVIYLPALQGFVLRINYYEPPSDVLPDRVRED